MSPSFSIAALVFLLLCLLPTTATAQRQNNVWHFGMSVGIDFNSGAPVVINSGMIDQNEGCAAVADRVTGTLLFYTSGVTVWNREHAVMAGGTGLFGHRSSTQSALIVPFPGDAARYYIFTADAAENEFRNGISYSIVDMRGDNGRGTVVEKNTPLVRPAMEKLAGVEGCFGEYWVIAHGLAGSGDGNDTFWVSKVTSDGVSRPTPWNVGVPANDYLNNAGEIKASPDGSMVAMLYFAPATIQVMSFDRTSGAITDPIVLGLPPEDIGTIYGISFSPDNSKLYVSMQIGGVTKLFQYDLSNRTKAAIDASLTFIATYPGRPGSHAIAPDGKIYLAEFGLYGLHAIERPNAKGTACSFRPSALTFTSGRCLYGLPNFIDTKASTEFDIVTASRDVVICAGSSTTLSARGGRRYRWWPAEGLSCTDCPSPIASPTTTTTYHVENVDGLRCSTSDSVVVTVLPVPTVDAGLDVAICIGDTTRLGASGGSSYSWSPSTGLDCASCPDPRAAPRTTTDYVVVATDSNGCSARDTVRVVVTDLPVASAGADTIICLGSSVRLKGRGGVRFRWSPSDDLSCDTCPDPIARPDRSRSYRLTVWNVGGCTSEDEVEISVLDLPTIDAGTDTTICLGAELRLHAAGAGSYRWHAHPDLSCDTCADPLVRPTATATYVVSGTSAGGCRSEDSITVHVVVPPSLTINGDSTICHGGEASIVVYGAASYSWRTSSGQEICSDCDRLQVAPSTTTTYHVVGSNSEGCVTADSFTVQVVSLPLVEASGGTICAGDSLPLYATGATSYRWEPSIGLSCSDCADPIASPTATTTYRVIGRNVEGCSDTAYAAVVVSDVDIVTAWLPRGVRMLPGTSRTIDMEIDRAIVCDTIELDLSWHRGVIDLESLRPIPSLAADGWSVHHLDTTDPRCHILFVRASPATIGPGAIATTTVRAYIGDSMRSELPFTLRANSRCAIVRAVPGEVMIDSICGLSYRLIESTGALKLEAPRPNPVTGPIVLRWAIPFDAHVTVVITSVDGRSSRVVVDAYRSGGMYESIIPAREIPSGAYVCRLTVGELVLEERFVVRR